MYIEHLPSSKDFLVAEVTKIDYSSTKPSLSQDVLQQDDFPHGVSDQYSESAKNTLGTHGRDNENLVLGGDLKRFMRSGNL